MKLTALAVVVLSLGLVLGVTLRGTATEAAPRFASIQFVDESIEAFNQTVVQPIGAAVAQLQGDVSDLDQRVTALEMAPPPPQPETSTYFVTETGRTGAVALCDEGDLISGGGYAAGLVTSANVYQNAPVTGGGFEGWHAAWDTTRDLIVHAICIDNPPLRSP